IGLPGFQLGWFKLRSGQRALAFLTDRTRVVYLPTTQDYVLLVSLQEAGQFISQLRAMRRDEN
ncbi:PH domain-containing protein, partial [candidate division KSB1 bacterium]|nr:PH domain-containing protein [candidate division KSB1 bacterium]